MLVLARWARWFHKLPNSKSPTLNSRMTEQVKQQSKCVPLDYTPPRFEVEEAIRRMVNRKVAGLNELPEELVNLFLDGDQDVL